ncbi:hypothetical protein WN944_009944 [Citrus x changshan-huyou]|uniref:Uncharacterized protein n=1 Tax=Citrus x changshan-huyou TaxID=2935761 RepID=A0AAP0QWM9_9ROSI
MAVEFNRQLKQRVIKLRAELPEAAITFADAHAATYELTRDAKELGRHFILGYFCLIHDDIDMLNPFKFCCGYYDNTTLRISGLLANRTINGSLTDPPIPIIQACHGVGTRK